MILINHLVELIAALSGAVYWMRTRDAKTLPFIWYLWLTISIETLGLYPYFYVYDNWLMNFLENSVMERNEWLYNIYSILGLILIGNFFRRHIKDAVSKRIIVITVLFATFFAVLYFIISGRFFDMALPYDIAVQTAAIFIIVILYYRELLKSDAFLEFYKSHVFYIGSALLLWNICMTPLFIFDGYFLKKNTAFVEFRSNVLLISNLLLYLCYSLTFFYASRQKRKLVLK